MKPLWEEIKMYAEIIGLFIMSIPFFILLSIFAEDEDIEEDC